MQPGSRQTDDTSESQSLRQLAEKARLGDSYAFEQIVLRFREDIFRMVYARTQSKMDAEDLTQEIFIKAYHKISGLKDNTLLKAWLYRIAINKVRDIHRKRALLSMLFISRKNEDDEPDIAADEASVLEQIQKKQFWNALNLFTQKLGSIEKEVFKLKYIDNLSIPEISQILDRNESTIKTHLYRAVRKFHKETSLIEMAKEGS
jgi:RNA polymerase sigma-70 factor (ECF subfamily)